MNYLKGKFKLCMSKMKRDNPKILVAFFTYTFAR